MLKREASSSGGVQTVRLPNISPVVRAMRYNDMSARSRRIRPLPEPLFTYVAEGRIQCAIGLDPPHELRTGDLHLTYPGEVQTLDRGDFRGRVILGRMRSEPVAEAKWSSGTYELRPRVRRITRTGSDPAIHELFRRGHEVFTGHGLFRAQILSGIVKELWLRLGEYWRGGGAARMSPRMQRMVQFLLDRVAEPVGRQELSQEFGLTPQHINRLFKQEIGISPTTFVLRERVHRAHRLLQDEGLTVQEAAQQVGFDDPFYFSRTFKRITGISPSTVR